MRRVRKHPVLDETEQLRGRVAQLEKEKQELQAQLAAMEQRAARPPKPDRPTTTRAGSAAHGLRGFSDSFAALAHAFGGSDAARVLAGMPPRSFRSGGLVDDSRIRDAQIAQDLMRGGPVEMEVSTQRTDYRAHTRQIPVYMRVTFGMPRNEAALHGELLIPREQFEYEEGTSTAARAVEQLAAHIIRTIRDSERTSNSFSRF